MKERNKKTAQLPDYSVYTMKWSERGMVFIFGFFAIFSAVYILFSHTLAAVSVALPCAFLLGKPARNALGERRKRKLLIQFRDFLDSLYGSFSAGKNLNGALEDTAADLVQLHGRDALLSRETAQMTEKVHNGLRPEEAIAEFAGRSDLDDIRSFADTVKACADAGGDLRQTVANCRDILCERMSVEQEIAAALAQTKMELYILAAIPFLSTLLLRFLGNDILQENTPTGIAVKIAAAGFFLVAVLLGRKISRVNV